MSRSIVADVIDHQKFLLRLSAASTLSAVRLNSLIPQPGHIFVLVIPHALSLFRGGYPVVILALAAATSVNRAVCPSVEQSKLGIFE
jgi:hypothetical protein